MNADHNSLNIRGVPSRSVFIGGELKFKRKGRGENNFNRAVRKGRREEHITAEVAEFAEKNFISTDQRG